MRAVSSKRMRGSVVVLPLLVVGCELRRLRRLGTLLVLLTVVPTTSVIVMAVTIVVVMRRMQWHCN
jgi:hypothetical protein